MNCEHGFYRSFPLSEPNELPRIVLRQCPCLHSWLTYAQEVEPRYRTPYSAFYSEPVRGDFRQVANQRRAWNE